MIKAKRSNVEQLGVAYYTDIFEYTKTATIVPQLSLLVDSEVQFYTFDMEVFFVRDTNNPIIVKKFGELLYRKRKEMDLSQEKLAFQVGISVHFFREIEKGRVNPSLATVEKIAKALGTNMSDMFRLLQTEN